MKKNDIKIKVCGVTNPDDMRMLSLYPIHAVGLNFINRSKRKIDIKTAKEIINELPVFIGAILIFEDENINNVLKISSELSLNNVQLHGNETPDYCLKLKKKGFKIIKALKAKEDTLKKLSEYEKSCDFILLDSTNNKNQMGGTGKIADWGVAKKVVSKSKLPIILAGGLNPKNISTAINKVKPFAIDVNSGVESKPGKKDGKLLVKLFKELQSS